VRSGMLVPYEVGIAGLMFSCLVARCFDAPVKGLAVRPIDGRLIT
jgi:hypothetical protein